MSAGIILFAAVCCMSYSTEFRFISLGVASLCSVVFGGLSASSTVIAQRIFGGLQSTSIMAIAFFVLAGNLMTKGGISRRIVNFANCLVGNVRGGMSLALVLACAFFAALSGSAPATVIAIGTMLYNDMVKLGYPGDRTAGLLVVSGGLGPIIPPSIILGGIYSGMLTATESAAIAVVWAAIAGLFIYKELTVKELVPILKDSAKSFCHDFIHHSQLLPLFLGIYLLRRFPGTGKRSYQHAFKFRVVLLRSCHYPADLRYIHGRNCYRCSFSTGPLPIAQSMGIDVIHFGMIVCISNVVGTMTPPVAVNIFSASTVSA